MRQFREPKMTVVCKACQHQFGAWRKRCPACGTNSDYKEPEAFNKPKLKREKPRKLNECIFCRRRGAKEKCPSCQEPIHKNCKGLHVDPCREFVKEVVMATVELESGKQSSPQ